MKKQTLLSLLLIISLQIACSVWGTSVPTPTPIVIVVTATSRSARVSSATPTVTKKPKPAATATATMARTSTPSVPMVAAIDKPVNCRLGPSVDYSSVGALNLDATVPLFGKTLSGDWWQIANSSGSPADRCWVAGSVTVTSGDIGAVAVVAAPKAFVTNVTVNVVPKKVTVPNCSFPYDGVEFQGSITTNGPVNVVWHWETSQGSQYTPETTSFVKYGEKFMKQYYDVVEKGEFWVKLIVTSPNKMFAQAKYSVVCNQ